MTVADEDLTPEEVAAITGTPKPARQAAELAKRGIAYVYTGSRIKVQRAVALFLEAHSRETYGVALREHNEAAEWLRALKDKP